MYYEEALARLKKRQSIGVAHKTKLIIVGSNSIGLYKRDTPLFYLRSNNTIEFAYKPEEEWVKNAYRDFCPLGAYRFISGWEHYNAHHNALCAPTHYFLAAKKVHDGGSNISVGFPTQIPLHLHITYSLFNGCSSMGDANHWYKNQTPSLGQLVCDISRYSKLLAKAFVDGEFEPTTKETPLPLMRTEALYDMVRNGVISDDLVWDSLFRSPELMNDARLNFNEIYGRGTAWKYTEKPPKSQKLRAQWMEAQLIMASKKIPRVTVPVVQDHIRHNLYRRFCISQPFLVMDHP